MESLTIGEIARTAGVKVETVRYYERRGLIDDPPRSAAGYRQYSPADVWRLRFIGRAKRLGFTLGEISEMIGPGERQSAAAVLDAAQAKLVAVDERQRELAEVRRRLQQLIELCEDGDPSECLALDVVN